MKLKLITTILILNLSVTASWVQAQVSWKNRDVPTTEQLTHIEAHSANAIFASATGGKIFRTNDAGVTWTDLPTMASPTLTFNRVVHGGPNNGNVLFACGNNSSFNGDDPTIIKSSDSGNTWQTLNIPVTNAVLTEAYMFDSSELFVVGGETGVGGLILSTTDGGQTWNKQNFSDSVDHFLAIDFTNSFSNDNSYAVGVSKSATGIIYRSTDRGQTWSKFYEEGTRLFDVNASGGDFLEILGANSSGESIMLRSITPGQTPLSVLPISATLYDVNWFGGLEAYTVGDGVYKTLDAGTTWPLDGTFPGTETLHAVRVLNLLNVYVGGENGSFWVLDESPDPNQVQAAFEASVRVIVKGQSINYTDQSTGSPTEWEWTFQGGTPGTSTDQNPQNIMYTEPGNYRVSLKATNAFTSDTETKNGHIRVTEATGIKDADYHLQSFLLFPNPASDQVTISSELFTNRENIPVVIIDLTGKVVAELEANALKNQLSLSTQNLVPGSYLVHVKLDQVYTLKLMIQE